MSMKPNDKILYTDGRDVVVTDSALRVRNTSYRLNGITKLCMWTIRPHRWPGMLLITLGLLAAVSGYLNLLPPDVNLNFDENYLGANTLALYSGLALVFIGILALAFAKERYAVRIATAEGEKNAIVSSRREYISQIVDAIHSAFDLKDTSRPFVLERK
jgi:hypothetical protein